MSPLPLFGDWFLGSPMWLIAYGLIPVILIIRRYRAVPTLGFSVVSDFTSATLTPRIIARKVLLPFLYGVAFVLVVFSLARPQYGTVLPEIKNKGLQIILAIDVSGSMQALDLVPPDANGNGGENRLEVVRDVVARFARGRDFDRLGLVVFAKHALAMSPLTTDNESVARMVELLEIGEIDETKTAIGSALGLSIRRILALDNANTKNAGSVIILLTDGESNSGAVDPMTAARLAAEHNIKVYTIGAGTRGFAYVREKDRRGRSYLTKMSVQIDEETLNNIASETGGKYFRATDLNSLKEVYLEIDKLEKIDIVRADYWVYEEKFMLFLWGALLCFVLAVSLAQTILRKNS